MHSWGSGANPWGEEKDDKFTKPNHWDGMLEVVGVTGVMHLGQIQSGLKSAIRIVQVSTLVERLGDGLCLCSGLTFTGKPHQNQNQY